MDNQERLTFPLLKLDDIRLVLDELNLSVSRANLQAPTAEVVGPLYEGMLEMLTGWRRDSRGAPPSGAIPFPELHTGSTASLSYFKALAKLMAVVGIEDFSIIEDLASPDRKRLGRHLSALINFAKYREEKLETYSLFVGRTDELLERKAELDERQMFSSQRLQTLREQQREQEPLILGLTEECAQLAQQTEQLNVHQARQHAESTKLKEQAKSVQAAVETHRAHIASCEADVAQLRASIVENPAEVDSAIRELTAAAEHERRATAKIEEEAEGLERKVQVLAELERDLKESVAVLREGIEEEKRAKGAEAEVEEARAAIDEAQTSLEQLESERQRLEQQLKSAADKMNRMTKAQKKREKEAARDLDKARAERAKAEEELKQNENKADDNARVVEKMEAKLRKLQDGHVAEMGKMRELYGTLESHVSLYNRELGAALVGKGQ